MREKTIAALAGIPLKTVKAKLPEDGPDMKRIHEAGRLVRTALSRADISQKEAAIAMGISDSQLSMQLDGSQGNYLSWQRMQLLPQEFFVELLVLLAEERGLAHQERTLVFGRREAR